MWGSSQSVLMAQRIIIKSMRQQYLAVILIAMTGPAFPNTRFSQIQLYDLLAIKKTKVWRFSI